MELGVKIIKQVISINSKLSEVCEVVKSFDEFSRDVSKTSDDMVKVSLALAELLNNVIEHGAQGKDHYEIDIDFLIDGDDLKITITDNTDITDWHSNLASVKMPDPLDFPEGGFGIAIIKQSVDLISYDRTDGLNKTVLIKNIGI